MNIYYNSIGVPSIEVDGIIYRFLVDDTNIIISELALKPTILEEIRYRVIDSINNSISLMNTINQDMTDFEILEISEVYQRTFDLFRCISIIQESKSMSLMLSIEKPYNSWVWDSSKLEWISPLTYPSVPGDNVYIWDELELNWTPLAVSPYPSWIWDTNTLEWVPPIKYPLDAAPNEFIWNEDLSRWVANV
jgi:hypothetical protein